MNIWSRFTFISAVPVISINGLAIGLPEKPKKVYKRSETKTEQYWESFEVPSLLKKIPTI